MTIEYSPRWEVRTKFYQYGAECRFSNCWAEDDKPSTFPTRQAAELCLIEHMQNLWHAGMQVDPQDFEIGTVE